MSEVAYEAVIVEVFPMRLGGEVLIDVTIRPAEGTGFPEPRPNDFLVLPTGEELKIWAAPRISQPKGPPQFNVQFQSAAVAGVEIAEGMAVRLRPR